MAVQLIPRPTLIHMPFSRFMYVSICICKCMYRLVIDCVNYDVVWFVKLFFSFYLLFFFLILFLFVYVFGRFIVLLGFLFCAVCCLFFIFLLDFFVVYMCTRKPDVVLAAGCCWHNHHHRRQQHHHHHHTSPYIHKCYLCKNASNVFYELVFCVCGTCK